MMKTTSFLRFACLVLAWCSTRAEYDQARAEVPTVDDPLQIHPPPVVRASGIKGCLSTDSTYNVRIHSLKTANGSEYIRQLVTSDDITCFTSSTTKDFPDVTSIGNCAEATVKNGLNSFSWESDVCTAYLAWRPQQRADCRDGGTKVVYVVKTPLKPFEGGNFVVTGQINLDALPQVTVEMSYHVGSCGFTSKTHKGFELLINDTYRVLVPEGTTTYNLNQTDVCSRSPFVNISVSSVGADGIVNSNTVVLKIESSATNWYRLKTTGCLYNAKLSKSYNDSLQYCQAMGNDNLFAAKVDGGAKIFFDDVNVAGLPGDLTSYYVGLEYADDTDKWTWLGGLVHAVSDSTWLSPPDPGAGICARAKRDQNTQRFGLDPVPDCTTLTPVVCYFPNP